MRELIENALRKSKLLRYGISPPEGNSNSASGGGVLLNKMRIGKIYIAI